MLSIDLNDRVLLSRRYANREKKPSEGKQRTRKGCCLVQEKDPWIRHELPPPFGLKLRDPEIYRNTCIRISVSCGSHLLS